MDQLLQNAFNIVAEDIHAWAKGNGFYDEELNDCEKIVLMHAELSEVVEGLRHNNPPDQHCPDFGNVEIELADCIIRILDYAHCKKFNIGAAIAAKMAFNKTREYKHGKEF